MNIDPQNSAGFLELLKNIEVAFRQTKTIIYCALVEAYVCTFAWVR